MSTLPARLLILLLCALPSSLEALTLVVDSTADDPALMDCDDAVPNDCSLRGAILAANAPSEASTIILPAGTYILSASTPCTYKLHGNPNFFTNSQKPLCVAKN